MSALITPKTGSTINALVKTTSRAPSESGYNNNNNDNIQNTFKTHLKRISLSYAISDVYKMSCMLCHCYAIATPLLRCCYANYLHPH